ncbi:MAG: hypothetical protein U0791_13475 [Gemmataceae bacterium]
MLRFAAAGLMLALAARAFAAPMPVAAKGNDAMAAARKALDDTADFTYQGRSLNDVVNDLKAKTKSAIIVDNTLMQFGLNPDMPVVNVSQKDVKVRDGLKAVLAPMNLRFGLIREGLFISTEDGLIAKQLKQRVTVDCDGTPFATMMKQLAGETGANIVVDPRLKEKATAGVTLKLEDVPLETAVRLLAEVADLKAVRMSNVLFVTTVERADKLRPDADGPLPGAQPNMFFPGIHPQPVPAFGFGGGVQVLPAAPAVDLPAPAPAEKKAEPAPEKK